MKNPEILTIKSDLKEIGKVEQFLWQIFEKNNLPEECFNRVFLCISEAVINSIEHGNKGDANKQVSIYIHCEAANICVNVSDEGEGFDHEQVDDPTREINIRKETGRGIYIIKSLSSKVRFKNHGRNVEFKIDLV